MSREPKTQEEWVAFLDDQVALCPNCWGRHDDSAYTCAVSHGWYTCWGGCSRDYQSPLYRSKSQVKAMVAAVEAKGREVYDPFEPDDMRGVSGTVLRQMLMRDGWAWPEVEPPAAKASSTTGDDHG